MRFADALFLEELRLDRVEVEFEVVDAVTEEVVRVEVPELVSVKEEVVEVVEVEVVEEVLVAEVDGVDVVVVLVVVLVAVLEVLRVVEVDCVAETMSDAMNWSMDVPLLNVRALASKTCLTPSLESSTRTG